MDLEAVVAVEMDLEAVVAVETAAAQETTPQQQVPKVAGTLSKYDSLFLINFFHYGFYSLTSNLLFYSVVEEYQVVPSIPVMQMNLPVRVLSC